MADINTARNTAFPLRNFRYQNKEDSLPNEESFYVDLLAGVLSELHIWSKHVYSYLISLKIIKSNDPVDEEKKHKSQSYTIYTLTNQS